MKFKFGLDKLLEHKNRLENEARREFAEAQSKVDVATAHLNGLYQEIDDARARAEPLESAGGAAGASLGMIDDFIRGNGIRIQLERTKVRDLMTEAETKRQKVVEAAQERKTLEILKAKRLEEYKKVRKKLEAKALDDLVVTRFARQQGREET